MDDKEMFDAQMISNLKDRVKILEILVKDAALIITQELRSDELTGIIHRPEYNPSIQTVWLKAAEKVMEGKKC